MSRARLLLLAGLLVVLAAGCSGAGDADRTVRFGAHDYVFTGIEGFTATAGERVRFEMANGGPADHEFEVFGPDGKAIDEIGPTGAGHTGHLTVAFAKPGTYTYVCGVSDHEARGMKGSFTVTPMA